MRTATTVVVAGVLLASVAAAGQQRPPQRPPQNDPPRGATRDEHSRDPQRGKWWQDAKIAADLRLTPEQSARIEEVVQTAFAQVLRPKYEELNKGEEQLSNLISGSNDVTEAQVLKQVDQVEAIRSALNKARTIMLFRMRRVLTPEQRTRLAAIQKEQERQRMPGRSPDRQ